VTWLSDATVEHLRSVADGPDLGATPYELGEPIARGGMGTVYRACDRRLERDVALKVMNAPAPTPGEVERMRNEARILARLEHPGIVPVHDLGLLPDGRLFYVMKLVRGRRLDEAMEAEPLHVRLRTFGRICEAVAFAHAQGVLHRDLKPANVMVGPFGEVLVLDWGLARRVGNAGPALAPAPPREESAAPDSALVDAPTRTQRGTVMGTPGYMSPEQARGETERIDERSDVYALGAILDSLGSGRAPRALAAICAKARAATPEGRYSSASELAADVDRFLAGLPVEAYPEGPVERVRRLARKYRVPLMLVAAYLLMRAVLAFLAGI
jgi:serine/threonine protein kinase